MTWYADEIIARATPNAVRAVRADAALCPFAYHVPASNLHVTGQPQILGGSEGLLVVRPVCDESSQAGACDWYEEAVLDSRTLVGTSAVLPLYRLAAGSIGDTAPIPPAALIARLKDLATLTGEPFVYYTCAMWGGDVEYEQAWLSGAVDQVFYKSDGAQQTLLLSANGAPRQAETDVLLLALAALGLNLPSPHFVPHTRDFPWQQYRLSAA